MKISSIFMGTILFSAAKRTAALTNDRSHSLNAAALLYAALSALVLRCVNNGEYAPLFTQRSTRASLKNANPQKLYPPPLPLHSPDPQNLPPAL